MRSTVIKPLPKFKGEAEERAFRERAGRDSTRFVDWRKARPVSFPNLRPSTKTISLRLSATLLDAIRTQAHKLDVPYQSLMKVWLAEKAGESVGAAKRRSSGKKAA